MSRSTFRYEFYEEYDFTTRGLDAKGLKDYVKLQQKTIKKQALIRPDGPFFKVPLIGKNFRIMYRFSTHHGWKPSEYENYYVLAQLTDAGPHSCNVHYSLVRDRAVFWKEMALALFCILLALFVLFTPDAVLVSKIIFGLVGLLGIALLVTRNKEDVENVRPALEFFHGFIREL